MIPQSNHQYNTRSVENVTTFYRRTDVFRYFYFLHSILEWKKLEMQLRRSESFLSFKFFLLKICRQSAKSTYNIHNTTSLKFLTRFRLGLSHLNEYKFKQNFCSLEIKSFSHFTLHFHHLTNKRALS